MIIQRGELIDAGRRFPAEDFVSVAGADECFVGKPIELPHAALGFGPKRNPGVLAERCRERHFVRGQGDLGRVTAAREEVVPDRRQKWRRQFPRHSGPLEEREQIRRPEFVDFRASGLACHRPASTRRPVAASTRTLAMHIASRDWRYAGNEPALRCDADRMALGNWPETAQNSTRFRFESGRRRVRLGARRLVGAQSVDHLKQERRRARCGR